MSEESTREAVRRLVEEHPEYNQSDIARVLGVSRERVRQIVVSEGLATAHYQRGITRRPPRPPKPRVLTGGLSVPINHTVAGTIAEMLVAADLMARGLLVYIPLVRNAGCDLVAIHYRSGAVEKIEVRCGKRSPLNPKRIVWNKPDLSRSDRRAIVLTGEPVVYSPPFPEDEDT